MPQAVPASVLGPWSLTALAALLVAGGILLLLPAGAGGGPRRLDASSLHPSQPARAPDRAGGLRSGGGAMPDPADGRPGGPEAGDRAPAAQRSHGAPAAGVGASAPHDP